MARAVSIDWARKQVDPRELPAYSISESAHYLRIPRSTLRAWVAGQAYRTNGRTRLFKPIIALPDKHAALLSFINLVEAHVLDALRREHEVPLQKVRKAILYVSHHLHSHHPLAEQRFETDGVDLFIQQYGELVNISPLPLHAQARARRAQGDRHRSAHFLRTTRIGGKRHPDRRDR